MTDGFPLVENLQYGGERTHETGTWKMFDTTLPREIPSSGVTLAMLATADGWIFWRWVSAALIFQNVWDAWLMIFLRGVETTRHGVSEISLHKPRETCS